MKKNSIFIVKYKDTNRMTNIIFYFFWECDLCYR